MKKIIIYILILCSTLTLVAERTYSTKLSFALSAAIPGAGDFYRRDYVKGSISLATEIALIATLLHYNSEEDRALSSYRTYAQNTLGFDSSVESSYYDLVNSQISSDVYNENVRLNAQNYYGYGTQDYYTFVNNNSISEEESWDWESKENYSKYKDIRARKQKYLQRGNIVVGTIIVNHVYSAIISAVRSSKHNKQFNEKHSFNVIPDFENEGVMVNYGFKF